LSVKWTGRSRGAARLVSQIEDMLRGRAAEAPEDELAELTGIRTGPSTAPDDPILSRLLPDFHRLDDDAPSKSDSTRRPRCAPARAELLDQKTGAAGVLLETCPEAVAGRLTLEQAEAWLPRSTTSASPLARPRRDRGHAGRAAEDDPRGPHLSVYHWLTWMQESWCTRSPGTTCDHRRCRRAGRHHHRLEDGWATAPRRPFPCWHNRCGGRPGRRAGTRETDLLLPENLVQHVDAICLSVAAPTGWPPPTA